MTLLFAIATGAYAYALWTLAACVAGRKHFVLGPPPVVFFLTSSACALVSASILSLPASTLLCAGICGAIICGVVDSRTGYIFDRLTATVGAVALTASAWNGSLLSGVIAAALVGGCLLVLYFATAKRGIGLGDAKLGSVIGLSLGLQSGLIAIGSAFVFGALYGVVLLVRGRAERGDAVRFGPFIAAGSVFALILQITGNRA